MSTTGFLAFGNIILDTKIMPLRALELKIWHFLHFWGGHFENPRWLPTADHFYGHQWIPCVWKNNFRLQDHASMCFRTENMAFFTFLRRPFWNPRWLPNI